MKFLRAGAQSGSMLRPLCEGHIPVWSGLPPATASARAGCRGKGAASWTCSRLRHTHDCLPTSLGGGLTPTREGPDLFRGRQPNAGPSVLPDPLLRSGHQAEAFSDLCSPHLI